MDRIEVKFAADDVDAKTGEFAGYGAVFGNIDSHGDVIVPGAFSASLNDWSGKGRLPAMKLLHGTMLNPFTGDPLPIGKWSEMREDAKGLFVKGRLSGLDTDHGRRIYGLMKDGILDGLSIGYKAKRSTRMQGNGPKRQLDEVALIEVSLVDDPSNDRARLTALKSAEQIKTIREFEDFLRDVGGFSNAAAKAIASGGFKAEPRDEDADMAAIASLMRRNIETLVPKG